MRSRSTTPLPKPPLDGELPDLNGVTNILRIKSTDVVGILAIHGVSVALLAIVWARSFWTLPVTVLALMARTVIDAYASIFYGLYVK
jgi:hypothetical protein